MCMWNISIEFWCKSFFSVNLERKSYRLYTFTGVIDHDQTFSQEAIFSVPDSLDVGSEPDSSDSEPDSSDSELDDNVDEVGGEPHSVEESSLHSSVRGESGTDTLNVQWSKQFWDLLLPMTTKSASAYCNMAELINNFSKTAGRSAQYQWGDGCSQNFLSFLQQLHLER